MTQDTQTPELPIIGAALPNSALPVFRDWLLEKQRDLELQSMHTADVLNGDWENRVLEAKQHLDGYTWCTSGGLLR